MRKPVFKQFGSLKPEDFEKYPVWVACHVIDYDEPWYDETDEETFRPWTEPLPVDPSVSMLLVRAKVLLRDGTEHSGFLTPCESDDIGVMQPRIFLGGQPFGFWGGMLGVPEELRRSFYEAVGKPPDSVFPLRVVAQPGLVRGDCAVDVKGFYTSPHLKSIEIEQ